MNSKCKSLIRPLPAVVDALTQEEPSANPVSGAAKVWARVDAPNAPLPNTALSFDVSKNDMSPLPLCGIPTTCHRRRHCVVAYASRRTNCGGCRMGPSCRDCLCCGGARCVAIRSRKHRFDAVCANAEKQLD